MRLARLPQRLRVAEIGGAQGSSWAPSCDRNGGCPGGARPHPVCGRSCEATVLYDGKVYAQALALLQASVFAKASSGNSSAAAGNVDPTFTLDDPNFSIVFGDGIGGIQTHSHHRYHATGIGGFICLAGAGSAKRA
jgi:hypothetical protein